MNRRYFGTDGVRGKVGKLPITPDFVMKLGQAAGRVLKRHSPTGHATVLIGKDTRVSGYMLEAALQAGFSAAGADADASCFGSSFGLAAAKTSAMEPIWFCAVI